MDFFSTLFDHVVDRALTFRICQWDKLDRSLSHGPTDALNPTVLSISELIFHVLLLVVTPTYLIAMGRYTF